MLGNHGGNPWKCRYCDIQKTIHENFPEQEFFYCPSREKREGFFNASTSTAQVMKIYTRTGDKGTTGLFGGKRVSKYDVRIEAIGTVDELNSAIGLAIAQNQKSKLKTELTKIQGDLFEIGAVLATPARVRVKEKRVHEEFGKHLEQRVLEFEKLIDLLTSKLSALRSFILPGGGKAGASLHLARSICRRAERRIVALSQEETVDGGIIKYINRLSDLLFTMARFVNLLEKSARGGSAFGGKKETVWKGLK